ncbi:MAG: helix-turn-helix domain-containing protein [Planctomycetota bacterium]
MKTTLLSISRHPVARGWAIPPLTHPHHEMLVFLSGTHWSHVNGVEYTCRAGDVLLFRPGILHEERIREKGGADWICLGFEMDDLLEGVEVRSHDRSGRVRLMAEWASKEHLQALPHSQNLANTFLAGLLLDLQASQEAPLPALIEETRRYVRAQMSSRICVDALAKRARLSPYHFIREYKRLSGLSPMADVRRLRLERARELVTQSNHPLKAIGPLTGLGEPAAFSRLFKKHYGLPPRALRSA